MLLIRRQEITHKPVWTDETKVLNSDMVGIRYAACRKAGYCWERKGTGKKPIAVEYDAQETVAPAKMAVKVELKNGTRCEWDLVSQRSGRRAAWLMSLYHQSRRCLVWLGRLEIPNKKEKRQGERNLAGLFVSFVLVDRVAKCRVGASKRRDVERPTEGSE